MIFDLVPIPDGSPWFFLDEDLSNACTSELRKEVGPEHFLYQWPETLVVIAKCATNDDVLVAQTDNDKQLFRGHLTWSGTRDRLPHRFPSANSVSKAELVQFFEDH